ncbi:hypothetical protein SteCoe_28604 [Stentor coeruleus]|uniref:Palmitoyltransferase n=1 Tax=Stentor coeruleus TaxID=5963 RepID=A0A1R2B7U4_9CILI|nr:hypothetical protein SteCoe_28604 [Stentor coeruleus]
MASNLEVKDYIPMPRRRVWHSTLGNCEGFIYSSSGFPLFILGPQWIYFLGFTLCFLCIIFLFIISAQHLMTPELSIFTWISYILFVISFLYTGLADPGIQFPISMSQQDILKHFTDRKFCRVCEVLKEEGSLHCIECDLCIREKKFHSLIFGKCIGKNIYVWYKITRVFGMMTCCGILVSIAYAMIIH